MHWIIYAVVSLFAFSVSALYQRLAMKERDSDPIASSIIFQMLLALGSSVVLLFTGFRMPPTHLWPYFLIAGILYALGTYTLFRAVKVIEASEMTILGGFGTLASLGASFVLLSERLSLYQWIGALCILAAVTVVKYERRNFRFDTAVMYALVGTTCYGLAVVADGYILKSYDSFSYVPLMSLLPGALLMAAFPKKLPRIASGLSALNRNLVVYSVLYVFAAEMFYVALARGALVSQLTTIMRASIIITVILAMIFLRERSHPYKKLAGAILTTLGILFIK